MVYTGSLTGGGPIAAVINKAPDGNRSWILDTGTAYHVIRRDAIIGSPGERYKDMVNPTQVLTANGPIWLDKYVETYLPALRKSIAAVIGNDTPEVLSLGALCKENGCSFEWKPYKNKPRFFDNAGNEVQTFVYSNVPYVANCSSAAITPIAKISETARPAAGKSSAGPGAKDETVAPFSVGGASGSDGPVPGRRKAEKKSLFGRTPATGMEMTDGESSDDDYEDIIAEFAKADDDAKGERNCASTARHVTWRHTQ